MEGWYTCLISGTKEKSWWDPLQMHFFLLVAVSLGLCSPKYRSTRAVLVIPFLKEVIKVSLKHSPKRSWIPGGELRYSVRSYPIEAHRLSWDMKGQFLISKIWLQLMNVTFFPILPFHVISVWNVDCYLLGRKRKGQNTLFSLPP